MGTRGWESLIWAVFRPTLALDKKTQPLILFNEVIPMTQRDATAEATATTTTKNAALPSKKVELF